MALALGAFEGWRQRRELVCMVANIGCSGVGIDHGSMEEAYTELVGASVSSCGVHSVGLVTWAGGNGVVARIG